MKGIDALNAWEITTGDPNIKIAVLDNGVDRQHPDLIDNVIPIGYDAIPSNPQITGSEGGNNPTDYHGTMVTGIIVAENNSEGIVGIAHTSKVFPIRMAYSAKSSLDQVDPENIDDNLDDWITNESIILRALVAAYYHDCDIVNGSFVSIQSQAFDSVLCILATYGRGGKGIPLVFAAGNHATGNIGDENGNIDGFWGDSVRYPASSTFTIGVGGASQNGQLETTFNHGKGLDLLAPGVGIKTTFPPSASSGVYYSTGKGSSFSSPLVAGTIALMLSVNSELTYSQIKEILFSSLIIPINGEYADSNGSIINTTIPNYPYGDWDLCYGYGFLNTHAAV